VYYFLFLKCAKVVIFWWKKCQKSAYLDNEFLKVAGNLTKNSTLLADVEANLTHDTCLQRMIPSPLPWQNWNKKTLALPTRAKTHFCKCLHITTYCNLRVFFIKDWPLFS
jgi:hypothetical protein